MLILICSLLLSFCGGFLLAINLLEEKKYQQKLISFPLSKNFISSSNNANRTFSLTSLVLFVFFPPQEISTDSASRD